MKTEAIASASVVLVAAATLIATPAQASYCDTDFVVSKTKTSLESVCTVQARIYGYYDGYAHSIDGPRNQQSTVTSTRGVWSGNAKREDIGTWTNWMSLSAFVR